MASSTTSPVASTSPSSVMVLIENPASHSAATVPTSATGIVTTGISVARSEPRKAKMTATTMPVAISSVMTTSRIERSMKTPSSDEICSWTPCGRRRCSSGRRPRTAVLISSVFDCACRTTPRPMAGSPFCRTIEATSSPVRWTKATSPIRVLPSM